MVVAFSHLSKTVRANFSCQKLWFCYFEILSLLKYKCQKNICWMYLLDWFLKMFRNAFLGNNVPPKQKWGRCFEKKSSWVSILQWWHRRKRWRNLPESFPSNGKKILLYLKCGQSETHTCTQGNEWRKKEHRELERPGAEIPNAVSGIKSTMIGMVRVLDNNLQVLIGLGISSYTSCYLNPKNRS